MTRIVLAIALVGLLVGIYVQWVTEHYPPEHVCQECPEPQPKIEDHTAAVMRQDCPACPECPEPEPCASMSHERECNETQPRLTLTDETQAMCPDCPTWDALKRAGVEIICENAFGTVPSVNYWPSEMPMGCSRIKRIIVDKNIEVVRR